MRTLVLLVALSLHATLASAQSQTAKVSGYIPYDAGGRQILVFKLQGNVSGGCNNTARFAINDATPKFKGTQAAVMAAFHTQSDLTVVYSPTCTAHSNAWDALIVCVGSIPC